MRALLMRWFGLRDPEGLYLSGKALIEMPSYRLPEKSKSDPLIAFRELKSVLTALWQQQPRFSWKSDKDITAAIFSGQPESETNRREYLAFVTGKEPALFLHRPGLLGAKDTGQKLVFTGLLLFHFPLLALICLFSSKRNNYAILQREFVDLSNALLIMEDKRIQKAFFFSIFDVDTNLLGWMLAEKGIHVTKITSDVPMGLINRITIGDRLATCLKYQEEEAAHYPLIKMKEVVNWIPEHCLEYVNNYDLPKQYTTPAQTLGFYSSGSWRRTELGHADPEDGFYAAEEQLIRWLAEYMRQKEGVKFIVFPHPYEKKTPEIFARTQKYYRERFEGTEVHFPDREAATPLIFDQTDVSISVYSTVSFERLFMGFKSLFFPFNMPEFPIPGSGMANISAKDKEALFSLLDRSLEQSREAFFSENGLQGYSVEDYRDRFDFEKCAE